MISLIIPTTSTNTKYTNNIVKNIKELYLNVSKLKTRIGLKNFNEEKD